MTCNLALRSFALPEAGVAIDAKRYRLLRDLPSIAPQENASLWEKAYSTGTWSDWTWALKQREALDAALDAMGEQFTSEEGK